MQLQYILSLTNTVLTIGNDDHRPTLS